MILDYFFYLIYNIVDFVKPARGSSFESPELSGWFVVTSFIFLNIRGLYLYFKIGSITGNLNMDAMIGYICLSCILYFRFIYKKRHLKIIEIFRKKDSYLFGLGLPVILIYCVITIYYSLG